MGDGTVKYIDTKYRNDIIIAKMAKTFCKSIRGYNVDMNYIASHVCLDYVKMSSSK